MLKKEEYLKKISQYLATFRNYVELNNSISLMDINKLSEDFLAGFLNKLFDLDLINMNLIQYNYPAIDLGDENSRICYQITSTNDSEKIQYTLDKFNEYSLNKKFDELNIFILTTKKKYSKIFNSPGINFTKENILDTTDLIKEISKIKNLDKLKGLLDYLEIELGYIVEENKDNSYENNLLSLLQPEIQSNVAKILSQSNITFHDFERFELDLRGVLTYIDEDQFMELKNTNGTWLLFGELDVKQYEKIEIELLKIKTDNVKQIRNLYSQFNIWNKYDDLFHMRKDEYILFREILLKELNRWEVKRKNLF